MKKLLVVVAILAAAAACGGAATSTSGGAPARPAQGQYGGNAQSGQPSKISGGGGGSVTDAGQPTNVSTVPVLQGPPVIRQAQLSMQVGSGTFDSKLSQVRTLVETNGGYIAGTDAQSNSATADSQIRTGVINFMVPAANFDATIDALSNVGKIQSEHITGTDVSAQYVDLRARLANLEAQHQAMLALLTKAQNINDIIAVQNQIGQITGQIEQLKGQIKYLDDNTSYSAVTVTLTEAGAPAKPANADNWGFATALNDAAHNFLTTVNYIVVALGAIGPFAILAGLGYLVWRRRRVLNPRHA
jgi:uncharacterized protein DUF4349